MPTTTDTDPTALIEQGIARLRAGDPTGAIADLTTAIRLDPDRADAYHHRAGAYLANWELQAALSDADTAVCRAPGQSNFWLTRANVRYHLGDVAAAWTDYRASFALDPDGNIRSVVDTVADQVARLPKMAFRDCANHLQANPTDFLSLARRGLMSVLCGQDAEADFVGHDHLNPAGASQLQRYVAEARRIADLGFRLDGVESC